VNPWHDVALGERIEERFAVLIEIPKGSRRPHPVSAVHYPANYGFLPQTYCEDGDPLDALVLCQEAVVPGCLLGARAIGVLEMRDEKGDDDKIIAVHIDDPEYAHYRDVDQLPPHRLRELERFFVDYKALENKRVQVERLHGVARAHAVIRAAIQLYGDRVRR
jgi:inorganic pyrophosphatase